MFERRLFVLSSLLLAFMPVPGYAQAATASPVKAALHSRYLDLMPLLFQDLIVPPPVPGTVEAVEDLDEVLRLQASRTPEQIQAAQRDDHQESMFAFNTVLGPRFLAADLPLTAALSQHLREESSVVNPSLKLAFDRPRPFVADAGVTPVCDRTASNSYPSGHAMVGYLEAFALAQMIPEKAGIIMERAHDYAHNRLVCGVHYPTDIEASRILAAALYGALSTSPRFQQELAAAKTEVRKQLALH